MAKKITKTSLVDEGKIREAIVAEVGRDMPRIDQVVRLIGRLNRIRGRRIQQSVLQLIGKPGSPKLVDALLGDNR